MDELISKRDLTDAIMSHEVSMSVCLTQDEQCGMTRMRRMVIEDIASAQTVDAAPVRHGQTNGGRIRQMTDEELADKLTDKCAVCAYFNAECDTTFCVCEEGVLKWLKQEVSRNDS